jgi:arabinofuranan 3-O-arabinosyltransferase
MAALVVLAFAQRPGQVTFDTKLDLTEDPVGFLGRALSLWNPQASFGELQNQAYGYLFPVGPFFALGELLAVPPWVVQRVWSALLLVLAYAGVVLVCRALAIGTPTARLVAGLAYALCPRMIATIGPISAETLIVSVLPWTVLPLVLWRRLGVRRAAALSALSVFGMGAANATLVIAVLPLPALVVLTMPRGVRWRMAVWWSVGVALACGWWAGALLVFGRYSPSFLDHVESAVNTAGGIGIAEAVRGATNWVAWVAVGADAWWPSAYAVSATGWLVVATTLVGAVGLLALLDRRVPLRTALLASATIGLVVITLGWAGPLAGPAAGEWRSLLDGALNPFRNVHKFDPLIRLPAAIGIAHVVGLLLAREPSRRGRPVARTAAAVALAACAIATVVPALSPGLRPGPGWPDLPEWWQDAAEYVAERDATSRTLVLPSTGFGTQVWGRTVDEPMQPLATAPWASRNQVFLGSEGAARMVEGLDVLIESGRGSPALGDALARAGIRYVIVRGDLEPRRSGTPLASVVRQALERSGGISRVAQFGPVLTGGGAAGLRVLGFGLDAGVPAIEIYEVDRPVLGVRLAAERDVVGITGGPESIARLLEDRLIHPQAPAILAMDAPTAVSRWLITDDLPRRERSFGRVRDNRGPVLSPGEPMRLDRAVHDILPPGAADGHLAASRYAGISGVSASTSRGYADSIRPTDLALSPWSAVDGDGFTAWRSESGGSPVGEWLQVDLVAPVDLDAATIRFVDSRLVGSRVTAVTVHTETGSIEHRVAGDGSVERLRLPDGHTSFVRVEIVETDGDAGEVGIVEVSLPHVEPSRVVVAPDDRPAVRTGLGASEAPAGLSFHRHDPTRGACVVVDFTIRCDPNLVRRGDESSVLARGFTTHGWARYQLSGTAYPRPGSEVDELLAPLSGLTATATSTRGPDLGVNAQRAVDGNPSTSWVAGHFDSLPTLRLAWPEPRPVSSVRLTTAPHPVATRPTAVVVSVGRERYERNVADGWVRFPEVETDRLSITVTRWTPMLSTDPGSTGTTPVSPGIAEVEIPGVQDFVVPERLDDATGRPCGFGPEVVVDGEPVSTAVVGTVRDLVENRPLRWYACGDDAGGVELGPGQHVVEVRADEMFAADSIRLRHLTAGAPVGRSAGTVDVRRWDTTHREITVATTEPAVLVVAESANDGWTAYLDGAELPSLRVDGWQQAWSLPGDVDGTVELVFTPQNHFEAALGGGAVAVAGLLVVAAWPDRRHRVLPAPASTDRLPRRRGIRSMLTMAAAAAVGLLSAGAAGSLAFVAAALARVTGRRLAILAAAAVTTAVAGAAVSLWIPGEAAAAVRTAASLPVLALVGAGALRAVTGADAAPVAGTSSVARQRPWVLAALALIVGQLGWRAWGLAHGYFWQDDFAHLIAVDQGPATALAADGGALSPGQFGVLWVLHQLAPLSWWPVAALVLALQLAASLTVLRLVHTLVADGPLGFVIFAVYVFSPLVFTATLWWSSALQTLPLQICLAWAMLAQVRLLRTGRGTAGLSAIAALVVGALFGPKAVVIGPLLVAFTVLVGPVVTGSPWPTLVRRTCWALIAYLTVAAMLTAGWIAAAGADVWSRPRAGEIVETARLTVTETFVPGLAGLMTGTDPVGPLLAPTPFLAVTVAGAIALLVVVAASVRLAGRQAAAAWLLLAGYLAVEVGWITVRNPAFVGALAGRDPRYTADAVVVAAVALCGVGAAVRTRKDRIRPEVWRARGWLAVTAAFVVGGVSVASTAGVVGRLPMDQAREYVTTARAAADRAGGLDLVDGPLPEFVMSPLFSGATAASLFRLAAEPMSFYRPTPDLRMLDGFGRPRPVDVQSHAKAEPRPDDESCRWPVRGSTRRVVLDTPLPAGQWVVRVSYYSAVPTTGRLTVGGHTLEVEFLNGAHNLYVELPETAVDAVVSLGAVPLGDAVCVTDIAVGTPWPAD